MYVNFWF